MRDDLWDDLDDIEDMLHDDSDGYDAYNPGFDDSYSQPGYPHREIEHNKKPSRSPRKGKKKVLSIIKWYLIACVALIIIVAIVSPSEPDEPDASAANGVSDSFDAIEETPESTGTAEADEALSANVTAAETSVPQDVTEQSTLSLDELSSLLELGLSDNWEHYTISTDEETSLITVNLWQDGVALELYMIQSAGGGADNEDWVALKDSMLSMYNSLKELVETVGRSDVHLAINLLNDQNTDNVLLTALDGYFIYDVLSQ